MGGRCVLVALAVVIVVGASDDPCEMKINDLDDLVDLDAQVQQLRSEIQELRSVLVPVTSNSDDSSKAAAPGRRRLQTSGAGETADIRWDGKSLNVQSSTAGKSIQMFVLGDLNVTGDIYLNGNLVQPTPAPTYTVCSSATSTSDTSWNSDSTTYSSPWYGADPTSYGPASTLDGKLTGNGWLGCVGPPSSNVCGDDVISERYLIYDLGSIKPIHGVQIGNGDNAYGVQDTLLQSGTSISGPWTTQSTFTVTNAANGGGTDYTNDYLSDDSSQSMTDYATDVVFYSQYLRLFFNSNYGDTNFYKILEVAVLTC